MMAPLSTGRWDRSVLLTLPSASISSHALHSPWMICYPDSFFYPATDNLQRLDNPLSPEFCNLKLVELRAFSTWHLKCSMSKNIITHLWGWESPKLDCKLETPTSTVRPQVLTVTHNLVIPHLTVSQISLLRSVITVVALVQALVFANNS